MEEGYWVVESVGERKERDVVYVDEEGDCWLPGSDFPCYQNEYKPIRKIDLMEDQSWPLNSTTAWNTQT